MGAFSLIVVINLLNRLKINMSDIVHLVVTFDHDRLHFYQSELPIRFYISPELTEYSFGTLDLFQESQGTSFDQLFSSVMQKTAARKRSAPVNTVGPRIAVKNVCQPKYSA